MQNKESVLDRAKTKRKQETIADPVHTLSAGNALEPTDLLAVIDAVVQQQPAAIAGNTRIGYELGLDVGHPWHDGRLSMFWLVTPEELDAVVDGFTTLRRQLEQLDIVECIDVELYLEPESSGFVGLTCNDIVELVGERWTIEFVNAVRYTHSWMDKPCSACSSADISLGSSEGINRSTSQSVPRGTSETIVSGTHRLV